MKAFHLVLAVVIVLGAAFAFARTWTDSQGNQIQGKFVRYHEGDVVILRGAKAITVPFESLSAEDQEFVRKQLEAKGQGDLLPPRSKAAVGGQTDGRLPVPGEERTWTSNDGKQIRARLVGVSGDKVTLLRSGREVTVPLSRLSAADQEYVKEQQSKRQKDAQPAPSNPQPLPVNPQPRPGWSPPTQPPGFTPPPTMPPPPTPPPGWGRSPGFSPIPNIPPQAIPPQAGPTRQVWLCSHCRRELPPNVRAGGRCPYCGTYLAYEMDASGRVTNAVPIGKYLVIIGLVPLGALVIGLVVWFLKSI